MLRLRNRDFSPETERKYRKIIDTQNNFTDIICHEIIVMPNHFHCIWENVDPCAAVGANLRVRPTRINVRPCNK